MGFGTVVGVPPFVLGAVVCAPAVPDVSVSFLRPKMALSLSITSRAVRWLGGQFVVDGGKERRRGIHTDSGHG